MAGRMHRGAAASSAGPGSRVALPVGICYTGRKRVSKRLLGTWSAVGGERGRTDTMSETGEAILIHPDGSLWQEDFIRLVGLRDNRPIYWIE